MTGTDLEPTSVESGLEPVHAQTPAHADAHSHPGPRQYVVIAVVLVILTGVEVATSYIDTKHTNIIILALGVMAAVKFFLVAAWYMHMKQDSAVFRRLFITGMALATTVYGILLFFFASTVLRS